MMLFASASYAQNTGAEIENTRDTLSKWVETQRIISKEKQDLALSKEILNERIQLVQNEIDSLREKIEAAKDSITQADEKRTLLIEENEKYKNASAALSGILSSLEERTKNLLVRLPDPIRERVKPLSQRLPKEQEESKLSLSERFQNVVGILNEINKFSREITVTSEVRALPDGTSAEVTTIYLGISQAYYVGANAKIAGTGCASGNGWVWKADNAAAEKIARVIAILKNEQVASYVQLPIETH